MKYFFYFGHPSQFHFQKNVIKELKNKGHDIFIFIRSKDILQDLLEETGWVYKNVLPAGRKNNKFSIGMALLRRIYILAKEILKHKPDILIASDPSFSQLGFLFRKTAINCIDDDIDVIGLYPFLTYPFSTVLITPNVCRVGKWTSKRISYNGYMKLAYLHPNWFVPNRHKLVFQGEQQFYLIRLSNLVAHHDGGAKGISNETLSKIIEILSIRGRVFISSEIDLIPEFKKYQLKIPVSDIHHYLYFAQILICDSQSMAGEAAMLGTPSLRINSFAGRISVLDELESKYRLTFGIQPQMEDEIFRRIDELLHMPNLKKEFQFRREKMLEDKIDVTKFIVWFIDNYPKSNKIMKENPDYQLQFK